MNWRRFFRPDFSEPAPGMGSRFGRLCYWGGAASAALLVFIGLLAKAADPTGDSGTAVALTFATGMFLTGRAACYLFGGE